MESFYGGKSGFSCVIVRSFSSVSEMARNFRLGGDYSEVHYGEYVLINTVNKNDADNGKLYRRGYDYTNSLGGAVYVGTIVGPAGRAPHLEMTTIQGVKDKRARADYDTRYTEGSYAPSVNLVPGKSGSTYNDAIEWAACSVRDLNGEDTTVYLGFKIPYLVEEFVSGSVDPYYNRSNSTANFENTDLVVRQDNAAHPFYQKWKINVPKGIKGDTFKNFKVVTASNSIQDYTGRSDDVTYSRKVLVYEYYHYDKDSSGEPVTLYLGDYNMIDGITITDEGTITIDYTHDDDTVYTKLFKWIKSVTLNKDNGHFTVEYNQATDKDGRSTTYETDLTWVKDLQIAPNGDVTLSYSTGGSKKLSTGLRWISRITMAADGTVTVFYNDGTTNVFDKQIQWIDHITLTDDGDFTVIYNNGAPDYKEKLIWVSDIDMDPDGTVKVIYNGQEPKIYDKKIKYIVDLFVENEGPLNYSLTFPADEPENAKAEFIYAYEIGLLGSEWSIQLAEDKKNHKLYCTDDEELFSVDITKTAFNFPYTNLSVRWVTASTLELLGSQYRIEEYDADKYVLYINDDTYTFKVNTPRGDQRIHVVFNTGEVKIIGEPLKYIDNVYIGGDKKLHIAYNTGEEDVVGSPIKFIDNVYVGADKRIHVLYNTGEDRAIGDPLNYITDTDITDDYHLVVYYSDPALREEIVDEGRNYARGWKDKDDWLDLGSVKEENGILIGLNLSLQEEEYAPLSDIEKAIEYLNGKYPEGLTPFNLKGKIVCIGNPNETKRFYAFDYTTVEPVTSYGYKGWFYLGTFTDNSAPSLICREDDRDLIQKQQKLAILGLWFVVED